MSAPPECIVAGRGDARSWSEGKELVMAFGLILMVSDKRRI